jgi:hypothetical protein
MRKSRKLKRVEEDVRTIYDNGSEEYGRSLLTDYLTIGGTPEYDTDEDWDVSGRSPVGAVYYPKWQQDVDDRIDEIERDESGTIIKIKGKVIGKKE